MREKMMPESRWNHCDKNKKYPSSKQLHIVLSEEPSLSVMLIETTFPQSWQVLGVSLCRWRWPSGHTHQTKNSCKITYKLLFVCWFSSHVLYQIHKQDSRYSAPKTANTTTCSSTRYRKRGLSPNYFSPLSESTHSPHYPKSTNTCCSCCIKYLSWFSFQGGTVV